MSIVIKDGAATDRTLKTTLDTGVHTPHHIVDSVVALPVTAATTTKQDLIIADTTAIQTAVELIDDAVYVDDADWTDSTSKHLLVGGLYQSSPQSVTDGDVAPIQLDANGRVGVALSPTDNAVLDTIVTNTGTNATEAKQDAIIADTAAIQTAVELIDDTVYADDADWTDGSSKHLLVGGLYQSSPQTVTDGDVAPIQLDVNGRVAVAVASVALPTTGFMGITSYSSGGQVQLAASGALKSGVTVKALSTNAASIFVGFTGVTATTSGTNTTGGIELAAKESVFIEVDSLSDVYIIAGAAGVVTYIGT